MLALPVISGPTTNAPSVRLGWDQSSDPIVNGYRVYWGAAARNYTNFVVAATRETTNVVITNLVRGTKYYFAATCTATNGLESDYSAEVTYTPSPIPGMPQSVTITVVNP